MSRRQTRRLGGSPDRLESSCLHLASTWKAAQLDTFPHPECCHLAGHQDSKDPNRGGLPGVSRVERPQSCVSILATQSISQIAAAHSPPSRLLLLHSDPKLPGSLTSSHTCTRNIVLSAIRQSYLSNVPSLTRFNQILK